MSVRVLGIDPGFGRLGIAILDEEKLLFSACLETNKKLPYEKRLLEIGRAVENAIKKWKPASIAMETLFFNQNTSTALRVAEVRGLILYTASKAGLRSYEYSPQAVKIAVTGYGKADKAQIESMVKKLIKLENKKRLDDEIDAIALCITHLATRKPI
jgi:crossover junction endodeoxyribonuclease RuvC